MTATHRIRTTGVVLALALSTSAVSASARPFDLNPNGSYVPAGSASIQASTSPTTPTIVHDAALNNGFDWGDAGFGAAGGLALSTIGIGGALAVSRRRTRRTHHTTTLTS